MFSDQIPKLQIRLGMLAHNRQLYRATRLLQLLTLGAIFLPTPAFAFPDIPSTSKHPQTQEPRIDPIAIFGDDDRRTEEQYARENNMTLAEVQDRYAATGVLTCDNSEVSASLTLANNVAVTAAHAFANSSTCEIKSQPRRCKFTATIGRVKKVVRVSKLVATGFKCPQKPTNAEDWAVLKLERGLIGVRPYLVENQLIEVDAKVTSVSAISNDVFQSGRAIPYYSKTIGNCTAFKIYQSNGDPTIFSSDCDVAGGASGGAILKDGSSWPALLGIHKMTSETREQLAEAIRSGKANSGSFVEREWAAFHVPLQGEFLKAVLSAAQE